MYVSKDWSVDLENEKRKIYFPLILYLNCCTRTFDIEEIFSQYWRSFVDWFTTAVKYSAQHVLGYGSPKNITCEFTESVFCIDSRSTFEHLDQTVVMNSKN